MFESPQSTIIKKRFINTKRNQKTLQESTLENNDSIDEKECFTPVFKPKNEILNDNFLRNSDEICFKLLNDRQNYATTLKKMRGQVLRNPQSILEFDIKPTKLLQKSFNTGDNKNEGQKDLQEQKLSIKVQHQSSEFLIINSSYQLCNDIVNSEQIEAVECDSPQKLQHYLAKARQQGEKLKNQNLRLKLQKVKLTAKSCKSDTFKLIPLKIQHQKLQKQIQKLLHQKEILQLNKLLKDKNYGQQNNPNQGFIKVSKIFPCNYANHKVLLNGSHNESNKVIKKDSSNISQSYINSHIKNDSSFSFSTIQEGSKKHLKIQNPIQTLSPENSFQVKTPTSNNSIRKFISSNNQSIKSFFNLQPNTTNSPSKDQYQNDGNEQKIQNGRRSNNQQTSKSSFLYFTKDPLKNKLEKSHLQNDQKKYPTKGFPIAINKISTKNSLNRTFDSNLSFQSDTVKDKNLESITKTYKREDSIK